MSHFPDDLTPLNLPKGETSDTTIIQVSASYSHPLESLSRFIGRLGEVGIMTKLRHYIVLT
jgi:hypothetical protein